MNEILTLSPKFKLEVYDFVKDAEFAKLYGIDKIPAIALIGERDTGIRFYGIPAGYEFTTLIEDLVDVAQRNTTLSTPLNRACQSNQTGSSAGDGVTYLSVLPNGCTRRSPLCIDKSQRARRYG